MKARRLFIQQLSALIAGSASLTACSNDEQKKADEDDQIDEKKLNAFIDTIVPKDQDPGAVEAGVPTGIKKYIAIKPATVKATRELLIVLDKMAISTANRVFDQLPLEQRETIIESILDSRDRSLYPQIRTISLLRGRIIKAFYASEASWKMLAFHAPYPVGYPDYNKPPPEK